MKKFSQIHQQLQTTKKKIKNVLMLTSAFATSHIVFAIFFGILGVPEMTVYNIFSALFFTAITHIILIKPNINIMKMDALISIELLLHQILAVYFIGLEAGFQYILIGMAAPIMNYSLEKSFKKFSAIKSFCSFLAFLVIHIFVNTGIWTPKYDVSNHLLIVICNIFLICVIFYCISKASLESYGRFIGKIKQENDKYKSEVEKQVKMQQNIISTVANIIEARDASTGQHTDRTSRYVEQIAQEMQQDTRYASLLTDDYIKKLSSAALLHDIGKIKIPDAILNKPGRLTPTEYELIKEHTTEGAKIIEKCSGSIQDEEYLNIAHDIALYHHERIDGTGYPKQLKGDEIPLSAKIMAVADVYDALSNKRCYKEGYEKQLVLNIMEGGRGTQFDENVLNAFFELVRKKEI